jgi:thiol:disulfide interchange protein
LRVSRKDLIALSAVVALVITVGCGGQAPEPTSTVETITTHGAVEVDWEDDFPAALKRAGSEGKPVLITFYADWCVWCKRLESTTLRDAKVMTMLRDKVVPLSLDVDNEGRELSNEYRVDGLPTVLVLDAEGREIGRIPGYMPPSGFLEQIEGMLQEG